MISVLYITTVPAPYKVAFFNELGKHCHLRVVFERSSATYRGKDWMSDDFNHFSSVFLNGWEIADKKISCGVISEIKQQNYDFIIFGCYSTIAQMIAQEYCIRKRIPYIHSSDGGMIKEDSFVSGKLKTHFISGATAWLGTGKVTGEYLIHYGAKPEGVYEYPFTSVEAGDVLERPVSQAEKNALRLKLGMHENKIILSVGQFIHRKGFDLLMKAASTMDRKTGVYIVGGKPTEEYLSLKDSLKLDHVHFVDFMDKKGLSEYYKAADVFTLPTREDIWGLVVNEAMAYGLPVVTTQKCVAGMEMIEDGINGILIKDLSEDGIRSAVNEMLKLVNESYNEVSQACLNRAGEYTIEKMAERHMEIFQTLGAVR